MIGYSIQGTSVGFLMGGIVCIALLRTAHSYEMEPSCGSCETHMPVRVMLRGSDPSIMSGILSRLQSSLIDVGWNINSRVVSSCGLRNPSDGSTEKSGSKAPGCRRHFVPMSPTFSSWSLRLVFVPLTMAPKKSMSLSSLSSTPTAEAERTMRVRLVPATSILTSSEKGRMRLCGAKTTSSSIVSLGLRSKVVGRTEMLKASRRAAACSMEQEAKTGEEFLTLILRSTIVPTLTAPRA
mmetsp:Transcript_11083/g.25926  ORF Transcript_11083/g.25926 Transcript_11083/m.25926 type:complete len:238 (-) Transcript_11083:1441-2154(-)